MSALTIKDNNILKIAEMLKDRAENMFDECAPFGDSPLDSEEYLFLMGISSALEWQIKTIISNLEFEEARK